MRRPHSPRSPLAPRSALVVALAFTAAACASTNAPAPDAARADAPPVDPDADRGPDVFDQEPDVVFVEDDAEAPDDDAATPPLDAATPTDAAPPRDAATPPRDAAPPYVPGCSATLPTCPAPTGLRENAGLREIDECAFRLADRNRWAASEALLTRLRTTLTVTSVANVVADGNRDAEEVTTLARVPSLRSAFRWNDGDAAVEYWYPQGITGSGDAYATGTVGGRRVVLVSWYDNGTSGPERGVRISFADVTNPRDVVYRHALLVTLQDTAARVEYNPVTVHAGGIVWYGRYLYVVDTSRGFRVFDMERILRVPGSADTIGYDAATSQYSAAGYKYVIPQVNEYTLSGSCPISFSFASLDRSTTPHTILSGEYRTPTFDGRLARWNLDPATFRLAAPIGARQAYVTQQSRVQGALSRSGTYYLSCSSQVGSYGAIYRVRPGTASREFTQPAGVEDLYYEPSTGLLWGLTEHPPNRYVYSAPLTAY